MLDKFALHQRIRCWKVDPFAQEKKLAQRIPGPSMIAMLT